MRSLHAVEAVESVVLEATRALLWIERPEDARRLATDLVIRLGGEVVPAADAPATAIPVDLSFGCGEPVLALADGVPRLLLEQRLPTFAEDAQRAVTLARHSARLATEATTDALTGLLNRRAIHRAFGRSRAGDHLVLIDLDRFKQLNDQHGHDAGDEVLRAIGAVLRATIGPDDAAGRFGGEELVVIVRGDVEAFVARLRERWERERPRPVTWSAGVAAVADDGDVDAALRAADEALYAAKRGGRNRTEVVS